MDFFGDIIELKGNDNMVKTKNNSFNLIYRYNCTSPDNIRELHHIIDNSTTITYKTFRKHVNAESFNDIKEQFGYEKRGLTFKSDWAITYHKSKLKNGNPVYYFCHSAIEYIFY